MSYTPNATSYTPTDWQTGDVIDAEKLNNIEDGLNKISQKTIKISIQYKYFPEDEKTSGSGTITSDHFTVDGDLSKADAGTVIWIWNYSGSAYAALHFTTEIVETGEKWYAGTYGSTTYVFRITQSGASIYYSHILPNVSVVDNGKQLQVSDGKIVCTNADVKQLLCDLSVDANFIPTGNPSVTGGSTFITDVSDYKSTVMKVWLRYQSAIVGTAWLRLSICAGQEYCFSGLFEHGGYPMVLTVYTQDAGEHWYTNLYGLSTIPA